MVQLSATKKFKGGVVISIELSVIIGLIVMVLSMLNQKEDKK